MNKIGNIQVLCQVICATIPHIEHYFYIVFAVTTTATLITWTNLEENAGTDGSWDGVSSIGDFSAKNAFQRQTSSSYPAFLGGGLPKTIWYNLRQPTVIGKFSFRNRRESGHTANNPLDFEFVGSTNCASWTVIQTFSGVVWSENDEEKVYDIENINLMKHYGFSCYGIRIKKISGKSAPCIQDIKMWGKYGERKRENNKSDRQTTMHPLFPTCKHI